MISDGNERMFIENNYRMFGCRVVSLTLLPWPVILLMTAPVPATHSFMVLSSDPLARVQPSGLKLTDTSCNTHNHTHTEVRSVKGIFYNILRLLSKGYFSTTDSDSRSFIIQLLSSDNSIPITILTQVLSVPGTCNPIHRECSSGGGRCCGYDIDRRTSTLGEYLCIRHDARQLIQVSSQMR